MASIGEKLDLAVGRETVTVPGRPGLRAEWNGGLDRRSDGPPDRKRRRAG